jgi:Asp-tRNA(Asn)/Glu-tRNA(Gln) amidotransferase A subunit family amidase
MEFKDMSLKEIISLVKSGKTTSKEVFDYFLDRIDKYDNKLQSFNFVNKN